MRPPSKKLVSHGFPNETILPPRRRATWPACARRSLLMLAVSRRSQVVLAALVAVGAVGRAAAQESALPVAVVNKTPITKGELDAAFRESRVSEQADKMPAAEVNKIKRHILQLLINRTL